MSTPIIVAGDPCGGPLIPSIQNWMFIGGKRVAVLGDKVTPHGENKHHDNPVMVQGSSWLSIGGIPVCATGDLASCGHAATGTQGWFEIP